MRKLQILCLVGLAFSTGNLFAQEGGEPKIAGPVKTTGEKKGWPSSERYSFISECIKTASNSLSADAARYYCYCMQEKVEEKYPTIEEAATITEADMQTASWQKDIKACVAGNWDSAGRENFLSECIKSAKEVGEEKAKSYCECMLFKVEKMYPNYADVDKLTADKLSTPEWKKIIQGCMDF